MLIEVPQNKISKIRIINDRLTAPQVCEKYKPDWFINGVLYDTITNETITRMKDNGLSYGYMFTSEGFGVKDNRLVWDDYKNEDTLDFAAGAPILRRNKMVDINWGNAYSKYIDGMHLRSAIGIKDDKIILYCSDAAESVTELANKIDADYLINLDGGGSCHLQQGLTVLRKSDRANVSWILIWGDNMKTNEGLVAHCMTALIERWGYVFGTWGQILTQRIFEEKMAQYPEQVGRYSDHIIANYFGKRTVDCGGLIKSFLWWTFNGPVYTPATDCSVDVMYESATEKDTIDNLPEIQGLIVWHKGHAGVYTGNGDVIESRGTLHGVMQTKLNNRPFTHWFKHTEIEYIESKPDQLYTDVTNDRWSYADILKVNQLGLMGGYPDGSFKPAEPVSREQMAVILNRFYKLIKGE